MLPRHALRATLTPPEGPVTHMDRTMLPLDKSLGGHFCQSVKVPGQRLVRCQSLGIAD
jgi:hypothetical protein